MARRSCRDDIVEAFADLLGERPFSQISITLISERAGISRTSYYRHFYTQHEVLDAYLDTVFAELRSRLREVPPPSVPDEYRDLTRRYNILQELTCLREHATTLRAILQSEVATELKDRMHEQALEILEDVIIHAQDDTDKPRTEHGRALLRSFFAAGTTTIACDWILGGCREEPEELASFILSMGQRLTLRRHDPPLPSRPTWDPSGGLRAPLDRQQGGAS